MKSSSDTYPHATHRMEVDEFDALVPSGGSRVSRPGEQSVELAHLHPVCGVRIGELGAEEHDVP